MYTLPHFNSIKNQSAASLPPSFAPLRPLLTPPPEPPTPLPPLRSTDHKNPVLRSQQMPLPFPPGDHRFIQRNGYPIRLPDLQ